MFFYLEEDQDVCFTGKGETYTGKISVTKSGFTCQSWNKQKPNKHKNNKDQLFPENSVEKAKNYCRNPDGSEEKPWCYTTESKKNGPRYELCDIVKCRKSAGHLILVFCKNKISIEVKK